MKVNDDQTLNTQFIERYFHYDENFGKYRIHKGVDRYPSFYYHPDDLATFVEKDGIIILLTYHITTWKDLKNFYNLMEIEIPF